MPWGNRSEEGGIGNLDAMARRASKEEGGRRSPWKRGSHGWGELTYIGSSASSTQGKWRSEWGEALVSSWHRVSSDREGAREGIDMEEEE
jgi:hypothetical protein